MPDPFRSSHLMLALIVLSTLSVVMPIVAGQVAPTTPGQSPPSPPSPAPDYPPTRSSPPSPLPADRACEDTQCGPRMMLPTRLCWDGSMAGPGPCVWNAESGSCAWTLIRCPPQPCDGDPLERCGALPLSLPSCTGIVPDIDVQPTPPTAKDMPLPVEPDGGIGSSDGSKPNTVSSTSGSPIPQPSPLAPNIGSILPPPPHPPPPPPPPPPQCVRDEGSSTCHWLLAECAMPVPKCSLPGACGLEPIVTACVRPPITCVPDITNTLCRWNVPPCYSSGAGGGGIGWGSAVGGTTAVAVGVVTCEDKACGPMPPVAPCTLTKSSPRVTCQRTTAESTCHWDVTCPGGIGWGSAVGYHGNGALDGVPVAVAEDASALDTDSSTSQASSSRVIVPATISLVVVVVLVGLGAVGWVLKRRRAAAAAAAVHLQQQQLKGVTTLHAQDEYHDQTHILSAEGAPHSSAAAQQWEQLTGTTSPCSKEVTTPSHVTEGHATTVAAL